MRGLGSGYGLGRLYVLLSGAVCGVLLGGVVFFSAAAWIVPEWTRTVGHEVSAAIALLSTEGSEGSPVAIRESDGEPAPSPASMPGRTSSPATSSILPTADTGQDAVGSRATREEGNDPESAVRELEGRLALLRRGLPDSEAVKALRHQGRGAVEARLLAWERLRDPLFSVLALFPGRETDRLLKDRDADIRLVAEDIVSRLAAIEVELEDTRAGVLESLDPLTVARLLLEERSLSDAQALAILGRFPDRRATEVLERLSRRSPERAARLLKGLWGGDGAWGAGGWKQTGAATSVDGRLDTRGQGS